MAKTVNIEETAKREYAKASGSQRIESIEISPSSNGGFSVRKRCKPKETKRDEPCAPYVEPAPLVFANVPDLLAWIDETL